MIQKKYSLCIFQSYPTQFDSPFFKQLSMQRNIELRVYYWDSKRTDTINDPEINRKCGWNHKILNGYHYIIFPTNWIDRLKLIFQICKTYDLIIICGYRSIISLLTILCCKFNHVFIGLRSDNTFLYKRNNLKWELKNLLIPQIYKLFDVGFPVGNLAQLYMLTYGFKKTQLFLFSYAVDNLFLNHLYNKYKNYYSKIRFNLRISSNTFVFLSIIKFISRENPIGLLKEFKYFLDSGNDACLIIIGDGPMRKEIESYIELHCLQGKVILTGYQKYSLLPKFFAISDVFIHPALHESWGCSVNEAMACELPVVVANTVGASYDLIKNGINGYIYNPYSKKDLCFYLQKLIKLNKKDLKLMGLQSKKIIEKWSYNTNIKEILRALRSLEKTS